MKANMHVRRDDLGDGAECSGVFVGEPSGDESCLIGTSIDIEEAFNSTSKAIIDAALRKHEVPCSIRKCKHHMPAEPTDTAN